MDRSRFGSTGPIFFFFFAHGVFLGLLLRKNLKILGTISKDPSRGHLRRSHPSRLVRPVLRPCNLGNFSKKPIVSPETEESKTK